MHQGNGPGWVRGGPDGPLVRLANAGWSEVGMAAARVPAHHRSMEVIRARDRRPPTERALAVARLIGALYVAAGLWTAWLTLTTPFAAVLAAHGGAFAGGSAAPALGWLTALTLPALCLLVGSHRILEYRALPDPFAARRDPLGALRSGLDADHVAVHDLVLPGGRLISRLIVGPEGIVVFGELPGAKATRRVDGHWEGRIDGDHWIAIEDPLQQTARDAEAVRRWLAAGEHGFVVKVYAALIAGGQDPVERNATTAVVRRAEIPAFLASLPPHRTFSSARRSQVIERIRASLG